MVLAVSATSHAEELGQQGTAVLAVERVFGINFQHSSWDGADEDRDVSSVGFGWLRSESAYHVPRAAFDYFVTDGLSIGGSVGFFVWGNDGDRTGFLISPRVGYAFMFNDWAGFWPRGGLTYYAEEEGNADYNQFALSLEGMFAFVPGTEWAILLGPTIDLGLTGEVEDTDYSQRAFGITTGLAGMF